MDGLEQTLIKDAAGLDDVFIICMECGKEYTYNQLIYDIDADGDYYYFDCCGYRYIIEKTIDKNTLNYQTRSYRLVSESLITGV